ncbi:MAG: shikimate kinase [Rothia sp. (in: high G+C Gram-positive bacteria)]|nr:shikimate kinase [Rothia sp. (in: high G+C Gram-positive bacteria)]
MPEDHEGGAGSGLTPPDPQQVREVQEDFLEKKRPLVIIGPMAAGKSYIGMHFAKFYGFPFIDADQLITEKYGSISEYFRKYGEAQFRKIEAETVKEVLESPHYRNYVFSLGGGAPMNHQIAELLHKENVVYIKVDIDTVQPRIENNRTRPMLQPNPVERWNSIFEDRRERYESLASYTLDARGGRSITDMAAELYSYVQTVRKVSDHAN